MYIIRGGRLVRVDNYQSSPTIVDNSSTTSKRVSVSSSGALSLSERQQFGGVPSPSSMVTTSQNEVRYVAGALVLFKGVEPYQVIDKQITKETGPRLTYDPSSGRLSRIDYDSGNYKILTYNAEGRLSVVDYVLGTRIKRKSFVYASSGAVEEVNEEELDL